MCCAARHRPPPLFPRPSGALGEVEALQRLQGLLGILGVLQLLQQRHAAGEARGAEQSHATKRGQAAGGQIEGVACTRPLKATRAAIPLKMASKPLEIT